MATIRKRRNRYCVIYRCEDENGKEHQKWETFATNEEAKRRKKEIEAQEFVGTIVVPSAKTLNELMEEYMSVYGVNSWAMSTYESKRSLYLNYIAPMLGSMQIKDISTQYWINTIRASYGFAPKPPITGSHKTSILPPIRSVRFTSCSAAVSIRQSNGTFSNETPVTGQRSQKRNTPNVKYGI